MLMKFDMSYNYHSLLFEQLSQMYANFVGRVKMCATIKHSFSAVGRIPFEHCIHLSVIPFTEEIVQLKSILLYDLGLP